MKNQARILEFDRADWFRAAVILTVISAILCMPLTAFPSPQSNDCGCSADGSSCCCYPEVSEPSTDSGLKSRCGCRMESDPIPVPQPIPTGIQPDHAKDLSAHFETESTPFLGGRVVAGIAACPIQSPGVHGPPVYIANSALLI